jgi:hypothetical protein
MANRPKSTKEFTLYHHIARPISVHYHKPIARAIHFLVIFAGIVFLLIMAWLYWLATRDILSFSIGRKFVPSVYLLLIPFCIGLVLLILLIYYNEKFFFRELGYLQRKYKLKLEHAFKYK